MTSLIYVLTPDGVITRKAQYSLNPKKALINYIMQYARNNWNDWTYPDTLPGIRESNTVKNHYYYDHGDNVIASYPV